MELLAVIIVLALVIALYAITLVTHARAQREWRTERIMLINRILSDRPGEIAAMDRAVAEPKPPRDRRPERPLVEGLN